MKDLKKAVMLRCSYILTKSWAEDGRQESCGGGNMMWTTALNLKAR